jgi:SAM-dependent methyltransferase
MKKYFEYTFNSEVESKLINFYNNSSIRQHSTDQEKKMDIKIKRVETLYNFSSKNKVLDIGCSKGLFLKKIIHKINNGVGIDISKTVIDENNKSNNNNKLSFLLFDGKNIPDVGEIDTIVMLDVLEHAFNPDKLIKSVHQASSDNTKIIIEVPFSGWFSELITKKYHEGHLRYYDPKYLSNKLRDNGFQIKNIKTYNSIIFSGFFSKFNILWKIMDFLVNLIPAKLYPYFGEIIVIARKNDR